MTKIQDKYTTAFIDALKLDYRHLNAGLWSVAVSYKNDLLGAYTTSNGLVINDIDEYLHGNDGKAFMEFLSVRELKEYCLTKIGF